MVWLGFVVLGVCWLLGAFVAGWGALPQLVMLVLFNLLVVQALQRYSPPPRLDFETLPESEN